MSCQHRMSTCHETTCNTCLVEKRGEKYGEVKERKRIIALAREWSESYSADAEGRDMPDFEVALGQANAFRVFANELENETCE